MLHSLMPRVRAAAMRFGSTCSNAPLAERYMSGKDITTAASTVAVQEKAIFTPKYCKKKMPMGRFTPNRYKRKKPATVGGSTSGSVSTPSQENLHPLVFHADHPPGCQDPEKEGKHDGDTGCLHGNQNWGPVHLVAPFFLLGCYKAVRLKYRDCFRSL